MPMKIPYVPDVDKAQKCLTLAALIASQETIPDVEEFAVFLMGASHEKIDELLQGLTERPYTEK